MGKLSKQLVAYLFDPLQEWRENFPCDTQLIISNERGLVSPEDVQQHARVRVRVVVSSPVPTYYY